MDAQQTIKLYLDMANSAAVADQTAAALIHVETAAQNAGHAATAMAGTSGRSGQGILGTSYAVQDFTSVLAGGQGLGRALASVQNNIPILVSSLGAGAGLAGVISIVSVGIGLLIDNWGSIQKLWKSGETEEETERMKKLAKAIDDAREATEKLLKTPAPWRQAAGKDIQRAVGAFGGEAVTNAITGGLVRFQGDFGPQANRQMAETLITNLRRGDPAAIELLKDLGIGGPIGQVLEGGRTPEEQQKFGAEQAKREAQELEAAKKHQEQLAKEKQREEEQAEKEVERAIEKREKDARNDDRERIQQEQRRIERADRENARFEANRRRDFQRAPVARMERATSQISQQMGFGTPTAAQANEMADAALRSMNNGMGAAEAAMSAVLTKMEAIKNAAAAQAAMWQRMQAQTQNGLGR
jgi:hypothetical protein